MLWGRGPLPQPCPGAGARGLPGCTPSALRKTLGRPEGLGPSRTQALRPLSRTSTPTARPAPAPRLPTMREGDGNRKTDPGSGPPTLVSRLFHQILELLTPHPEGPCPRPQGAFKAPSLSSAPPRPCPGSLPKPLMSPTLGCPEEPHLQGGGLGRGHSCDARQQPLLQLDGRPGCFCGLRGAQMSSVCVCVRTWFRGDLHFVLVPLGPEQPCLRLVLGVTCPQEDPRPS